MTPEDKKPVSLTLNLTQAEARRFLEDLADAGSALRQGLVGDDPNRVLAEYDIVLGDEALRSIQLPEPEEVQQVFGPYLESGSTEQMIGPSMDGRCRGWAVVYAAAGTAHDEPGAEGASAQAQA